MSREEFVTMLDGLDALDIEAVEVMIDAIKAGATDAEIWGACQGVLSRREGHIYVPFSEAMAFIKTA